MPRGSPWWIFSLTAMSNKTNLFKCRCVPGELWLKGMDKLHVLKKIWFQNIFKTQIGKFSEKQHYVNFLHY